MSINQKVVLETCLLVWTTIVFAIFWQSLFVLLSRQNLFSMTESQPLEMRSCSCCDRITDGFMLLVLPLRAFAECLLQCQIKASAGLGAVAKI